MTTNPDNMSFFKRSYDFGLSSFIINFNILDTAVGTIVGFALSGIIKDFVTYAILPVVKHVFFRNPHSFYIRGIKFDVEKIVDNIIYFVIILVILYLFLKLVLGGLTGQIIKNREQNVANQKRLNQKMERFYERNIEILEKIEKNLDKSDTIEFYETR